MAKQRARLENWGVVPLGTDPYTPPECRPHGLAGTVFGSSRFSDGSSITTTPISVLRAEGDDAIAITRSGSEYLLGQVDPEYERQFPNARARVMKSFA